jgi:hypothetical protein
MHAEAGLLTLQALSLTETEVHLGASTTLFVWSREAAATARTSPHGAYSTRTQRSTSAS